MAYADYHARDWAAGKTREELDAEIARVEQKLLHTYAWGEVGNAEHTRIRLETLQEIRRNLK